MTFETVKCPSCGSSAAKTTGKHSFECEHCAGTFLHVERSDLAAFSSSVRHALTCAICGSSDGMKRCIFCGEGACKSHAIEMKGYECFVCRQCLSKGPGGEFKSVTAKADQLDQEVSRLAREIVSIESDLEDNATYHLNQRRSRKVLVSAAKGLGIGLLVLIIGAIAGHWSTVLFGITAVPITAIAFAAHASVTWPNIEGAQKAEVMKVELASTLARLESLKETRVNRAATAAEFRQRGEALLATTDASR